MSKYLLVILFLCISTLYVIHSAVASIQSSPAATYFHSDKVYASTAATSYQGDYSDCTRVGTVCVPYPQPAPVAIGEPHE